MLIKMRIKWFIFRLKRIIPLVLILLVFWWLVWGRSFYLQNYKSIDYKANFVSVEVELETVKPPKPMQKKSHWLVITHIEDSDPCNMLAFSFSEWTILLVNYSKPNQYTRSSCIYMNDDVVKDLLKHHDILQEDYLAGYVFAILNGAEVIYTPPVGIPFSDLHVNCLPEHSNDMIKSFSQPFFSSHRHYGCNESLYDIHFNGLHSYVLCDMFKKVAVEVPAALYLDSTKSHFKNPHCDKASPDVALDVNTYAEIHLDGAKIHHYAFWVFSLCNFPSTITKDCFYWKLLLQKLLWLTEKRLVVFYDILHENVNSKEQLRREEPSQQELDIFFKYLTNWTCPLPSFMGCGINLMEQMSSIGILSRNFTNQQIKWFRVLNNLSYRFPMITEEKPACDKTDLTYYPVNFTGYLPWQQGKKHPLLPIPNFEMNQNLYKNTCSEHPSNTVKIKVPWMQVPDILLIVVFNNPLYDIIPYIELEYRSFFPHILYCGPLAFDRNRFAWSAGYSFSFITYDNIYNHTAGAFNYKCLTNAMKMNYRVAGYLVIADDLLLIPHSLSKFRKESLWYLPKNEIRIGEIKTLRECRLGMCDFHPHWHWWEEYQHATIAALEELKIQQHSSLTAYNCYRNLVRTNGGEIRPNGAYSDIYYVPSRLKHSIIELFRIFLKHKVMVEIAVPTVLTCLEDHGDMEQLPGLQLWELDRDMPWKYFEPKHIVGKFYLHPTKWSFLQAGVTNFTSFFCTKVLPYLHDPFERIPL